MVYIRFPPFCGRSTSSFEIIISVLTFECSVALWCADCHNLLSAKNVCAQLTNILRSPSVQILQAMRKSRIVILLLHHYEYEYCRRECVCISYKLGICFCHQTKLRSGLTMLAIDALALVTTSNSESHTAPDLETFFLTICEHICCWKIGVIESQQTGTKQRRPAQAFWKFSVEWAFCFT